MDQRLSKKIKTASLLLIVMVVWLHSYNIDIKQGGRVLFFEKGFNWALQDFISGGLTRIAVPLFFMISGYLFFSSAAFTFADYRQKVSKRFKTLVIPYLFWALFGLFFYFLLQSIPQSQGFFTKQLIRDYGFSDWLNAVFNEPVPYQLWFLKDLIVLVFLSPLLYFLLTRLKLVFLAVVCAFWLFSQDTVFLTSEALLFFSLGAYIRNYKNGWVGLQFKNPAGLFLCWMLLLAIKTGIGFTDWDPIIGRLFLKASILVGIVAFWSLLDTRFYNRYLDRWVSRITAFSFFIYAFHEPFLTIIKKGMFAVLPKTPNSYLLVYLTAPFTILLVSIFTAVVLQRLLPSFYKIITGNR